MQTTDPGEFLSELGDVNAFIADLLHCPRKPGWHWPTFYLLYVEVDRLATLVSRVGNVFDGPVPGPKEPSLDDIGQDAVSLLAMIDRQQKSIVGALVQIVRNTKPASGQEALHGRVGAHVHPKSGWYQAIMHGLQPGMISEDGQFLLRTALPVDTGQSSERMDSITAECLQRHQTFDIGSPDARKRLAAAARTVEQRLGAVLGPMGKFLLAHCRMEDLMHPCSH